MFDINLARNEYCRAIYVDFEIKNRFVNKNGETKYLVLHSVLPVNTGFPRLFSKHKVNSTRFSKLFYWFSAMAVGYSTTTNPFDN